MAENSKRWDTALKIFIYLFDVVSDWVNGILLIIGDGNHPNGDYALEIHTNRTDPCNKRDDGKPHVAWGSMTLGFSYLPAGIGLLYLVRAAAESKSIPNMFLLPLRFLLWPLLVPISM